MTRAAFDQELDKSIVQFIRERAASDEYAAYCRNILAELMEIDTTIGPDIDRLRANEAKTFDLIESELRSLLGERGEIRRHAVPPTISANPSYSMPAYAATDSTVPPAEQVYADRHNLVVRIDGDGGGAGSIHNTHIDTVAPFVKPNVRGQRITGRGACDAKGQAVLMIAQIKLLEELRSKMNVTLAEPRTYQFVIDEEIGGNGTLALLDEGGPAGQDVIVYEPTDGIVHPANRGAMWYHCRIQPGPEGGNPVEIMPFVVCALEKAGRQIRAESDHPLFSPDHVHTNHGVLGPYGTSPSAVNDHVAFTITIHASANPERIQMRMVEMLDVVLADYARRYGDKTRQIDASTSKPALARHYDLRHEVGSQGHQYRLDIYGTSGHMGAVNVCDGAITKAAHVLRALLMIARNYPKIEAWGALADQPDLSAPLALEGGQGFLPTHSLDDVATRLTDAAEDGLRKYCEVRQIVYAPEMVEMTFNRLRNDAYASPIDAPVIQAFAAAHRALGMTWPEPTGWGASCDARLFAARGHNVVTFGPGSIDQAHSSNESIDLRRIQRALAISALATACRGPIRRCAH